jgi:hypothetical protein
MKLYTVLSHVKISESEQSANEGKFTFFISSQVFQCYLNNFLGVLKLSVLFE